MERKMSDRQTRTQPAYECDAAARATRRKELREEEERRVSERRQTKVEVRTVRFTQHAFICYTHTHTQARQRTQRVPLESDEAPVDACGRMDGWKERAKE